VSAVPAAPADPDRCGADVAWAEITSAAPQLAETMRRYLGPVW
jgi:hypothetical protein